MSFRKFKGEDVLKAKYTLARNFIDEVLPISLISKLTGLYKIKLEGCDIIV